MNVLLIVDVQREFSKFIQFDLVEELNKYCKDFDAVYQIWDGHKNTKSPSYKFPKEVKAVEKLFGNRHFSDKVKEYTDEIKDITDEGTTFKLSNGSYVVRVDNNHDWFYVNPDITNLIYELMDDNVTIVGGADNECLEDVYVAFKAFNVDITKNEKYIYSAKTSNKQSIYEMFTIKRFKDI